MAANESAKRAAGGKGRRVALSSTNSIPARSPRPRTSPTQGSARRLCSRRCRTAPIAAQRSIRRFWRKYLRVATPAAHKRGMMRERLRMEERPGASRQDIDQPARRHHRRQRRVAPRDSLAEYHDIRHDTVRLQRRPGSGPAGPGEYLVGHQQDLRDDHRSHAPGASSPAAGTEAPLDEPPTGSAMSAATVSGPSLRIAASMASPLHDRTQRCDPPGTRSDTGKMRRDPDDLNQPLRDSRSCTAPGTTPRGRAVCCRDRRGPTRAPCASRRGPTPPSIAAPA